jgi:hypothetical protein
MDALHTARLRATDMPPAPLLVSVVIPCLDEAESVGDCVRAAASTFQDANIEGEVVVVDNGSRDGSGGIASRAGARVIHEPRRGYGSAYLAGFRAARGRYLVMADADGTYDLSDVPRFLSELEAGADVVVGSRLQGTIHEHAMPWLHRRIGNPALTAVLNRFFGTGVTDAHCGMRAFRRDLLERLNLQATGMELASEHLIRAAKLGLDIREIPIDYGPRVGESKLDSLSDGWRHLRLLLVHSPTWLFLVPGGLLFGLGALAGFLGLVLADPSRLPLLVCASMLAMIATQLLQFGTFARAYAVWVLGERDPTFDLVRKRLSLETVLTCGTLVGLGGLTLLTIALVRWGGNGFGVLEDATLALAGLTAAVVGAQIVFAGFLLSVLGLRARRSQVRAVSPDEQP